MIIAIQQAGNQATQSTDLVAPAVEPHPEWFYVYDQELEVLKAYNNRGAVQTMHVPRHMLERLYYTIWANLAESDRPDL
jgi:hypothetical protein